VLDRATFKLTFMASQAGGMEIEESQAKDPEQSTRTSSQHCLQPAGAQPSPSGLVSNNAE